MKKKIVIVQAVKNSIGGVWFVNETLSREFIKQGYDVTFLQIRVDNEAQELEVPEKVKEYIVNPIDPWEIVPYSEAIKCAKRGKLFDFITMILNTYFARKKLQKDFKHAQDFILEKDFDYIITSHYQVLNCVPSKLLKRCMHVSHTSFKQSYCHQANRKMLERYNGKVKFIWLTKASSEAAANQGFLNNYTMYNPVRIPCIDLNVTKKDKNLITLARLSEEKNLGKMINIVERILCKEKFSDWQLYIYGDGPLYNELHQQIKNKRQIHLCEAVKNPKDVLSTAAIYLCTSSFEGFPLSVLEGYACGVPIVSVNFGESVYEVIQNNSTGFVVDFEDEYQYQKQLEILMENADLQKQFSKNALLYVEQFNPSNIVKEWMYLFDLIEKESNNES